MRVAKSDVVLTVEVTSGFPPPSRTTPSHFFTWQPSVLDLSLLTLPPDRVTHLTLTSSAPAFLGDLPQAQLTPPTPPAPSKRLADESVLFHEDFLAGNRRQRQRRVIGSFGLGIIRNMKWGWISTDTSLWCGEHRQLTFPVRWARLANVHRVREHATRWPRGVRGSGWDLTSWRSEIRGSLVDHPSAFGPRGSVLPALTPGVGKFVGKWL